MRSTPQEKLTVGWREWVSLPDLGVTRIKAKVDTGARTSAIHATRIRPYTENGRERVEFIVQPMQRKSENRISCRADIVDKRMVSDSGGHKEERFVIETALSIGDFNWPIEVTLTSRGGMRFSMLLGRTAIASLAIVDPGVSYLVGKRPRKKKT